MNYDLEDAMRLHEGEANEQRRKVQEFDRQMREALAAIAATPEGLAFLRWLIDQSGILKSQYPGDHAQATYIEGKRSMGAKLIAMAVQAGKLPAILEGNCNGN